LTGLDRIKAEVDANNGQLHPVYIPILKNIDPGKLQSAHNASELSRELVTEWLVRYKFRDWKKRSSTGEEVTDELRKERAKVIAGALCEHQKWLSHGRPIKIADLEAMKVKITDYGKTPDLQALIWQLWVHINHIFSGTNAYKIYESETLDLARVAVGQFTPAQPNLTQADKIVAGVKCSKCQTEAKIQADFTPNQTLQPGAERFPPNSLYTCKACGNVINLTGLKLKLEADVKKPIIL
jgi:hypothetical protein